MTKRILTIQDISTVGQCSGAVALPILSIFGMETCLLPTSVLSSHTAFSHPVITDLSDNIVLSSKQWESENITFDGIYTGYLSSEKQIDSIIHVIQNNLIPNGLVFVDPVMADHGKLYAGFDEHFIEKMKILCSKADYIFPNLTEACLLTKTSYQEEYDEEYIKTLLNKLNQLGCKNIIITSVSYQKNTTGVACCIDNQYHYYAQKKINRSLYGTGDIFASVFVGAISSGHSLEKSIEIASDFIALCIKNTSDDHWYGTEFQSCLPYLFQYIQ